VRRFSRLFSAHVDAAPEAETTVPNPGLAMTLTHGNGVSSPPWRTITYSFPPSAKPPMPLVRERGGGSADTSGTEAFRSRRGTGEASGNRLGST
jgi:hypothetical protein